MVVYFWGRKGPLLYFGFLVARLLSLRSPITQFELTLPVQGEPLPGATHCDNSSNTMKLNITHTVTHTQDPTLLIQFMFKGSAGIDRREDIDFVSHQRCKDLLSTCDYFLLVLHFIYSLTWWKALLNYPGGNRVIFFNGKNKKHVNISVCQQKNGYFKSKHDLVLTVFVPGPAQSLRKT